MDAEDTAKAQAWPRTPSDTALSRAQGEGPQRTLQVSALTANGRCAGAATSETGSVCRSSAGVSGYQHLRHGRIALERRQRCGGGSVCGGGNRISSRLNAGAPPQRGNRLGNVVVHVGGICGVLFGRPGTVGCPGAPALCAAGTVAAPKGTHTRESRCETRRNEQRGEFIRRGSERALWESCSLCAVSR
eukprot:794171-Pleurochrysis_carterae.AAC.1